MYQLKKEARHSEINFTGTGFLFMRRYETVIEQCPYEIELHQHEWHEFVWNHAPQPPDGSRNLYSVDGVSFPYLDANLLYAPPFHNHRFAVSLPMTTCIIGVDQTQICKMFAHSPLARPLESMFASWSRLSSCISLSGPGAPSEAAHELDVLTEACYAPGSLESLDAVYFLVAFDRIISPWKAAEGVVVPESPDGGGVVRLAMEYLEKNFARQIGVDDCAAHIGVARSTLSHNFRAVTGLSIPQWLSEVRLRHARALLVDTNLDIIEIALECGFNDPAWFSRQFRTSLGMTPSGWRNRHRSMLNSENFRHDTPVR